VTLVLVFALLSPYSAEALVYMTPKEALKQAFASSQLIRSERKELSDGDREKLSEQLGYPFEQERVTFLIGETEGRADGYALIDNEIGKTQPITFLTLIDPQGKIAAIEVLVYRESHGSQIRYAGFREQFYGKDRTAPLKVGQDVQNISGATLSVRAATRVAKRALILWNYFYGPQ